VYYFVLYYNLDGFNFKTIIMDVYLSESESDDETLLLVAMLEDEEQERYFKFFYCSLNKCENIALTHFFF